MPTPSSPDALLDLLHGVDSLRALAPETLHEILAVADIRDVARGATLIQEGAAADTLFLVLKGRFVVLAGGVAIAEIAQGEPIGELAFFAGGTRTATVVAARKSIVLALSRSAYEALSARSPAVSGGILAALSQRLARTVATTPKLRPRAGAVVAVFGGGGAGLEAGFAVGLEAAFQGIEGWRLLRRPAQEADLIGWLGAQESAARNLVILVPDPVEDAWSEAAINIADTVVVVLARADGPPPVSPLETRLSQMTLRANTHLVLTRAQSATPTLGTAAFLAGRSCGLHHHLALDSPADFARLGRFLRGEALGMVLCGGGSFGTAHLGAVQALQEAGIEADFYGGTSIGMAMAAALATGMAPAEAMDICDDMFVRSGAMKRPTLPFHGVLDHHFLDRKLQEHYGDLQIEDAPINLFGVATSLTTNDSHLLRSGPIWRAIRASASIPGVFAPVVTEAGEVLIDGGLIDNVPLGEMRDLKPGPNLVLNFSAGKPWRVAAKYEDLPTRGQALWGALRGLVGLGARGRARHPRLFSVLSRSMVVNARKLLENTDMGEDVLMNIPTLRGMSFLDWARGRELFDAAYGVTQEALTQDPETQGEMPAPPAPIERLRAAAARINALEAPPTAREKR